MAEHETSENLTGGLNGQRDDIVHRAIGEGPMPLLIVGLALVFSGCFAIFVALTGDFLPHDALHLGFGAANLGSIEPALVQFMLSPRTLAGALLWIYAGGLLRAGSAILVIAGTVVFVPEDIAFMRLCGADIDTISRRLLAVIAHDRSSFGAALLTLGLTLLLVFRTEPFTRSLWQVVGLSDIVGFSAALGIHFHVGYFSFTHLAPAYAGFAMFVIGWTLSRRQIASSADAPS